jgi:hypothetical protein
MSVTNIPNKIKTRLWVKSAGRCEYEGCNKNLTIDPTTKKEFNAAYIAHIYAEKPGGARYDDEMSPKLRADFSNLMILCDVHHRLIDIADVDAHSVERLKLMKKAHEERIERLCGIQPNLASEILLYSANIGERSAPVSFRQAVQAILPDRYPASSRGISIGIKNSEIADRDEGFWLLESQNLCRAFDRLVRPVLAQDGAHLSVFALAPQPLLVLLGSLLSDLHRADVHQLHREPVQTWSWDTNDAPGEDAFDPQILPPEKKHATVAVVFSISAAIAHERVHRVLGSDVSVWSVQISNPHNDALRSRRNLDLFRSICRELFQAISREHPSTDTVHIFPAMPVSAAVELGRVHMPKADPSLRVYDEQPTPRGFVQALSIPLK